MSLNARSRLIVEWLEERCLLSYTIVDLGTLGGEASRAYDVNAAGQVVGQAETADGRGHAFLYSQGQMKDLGTLGGPTSSARAINAQGEAAGVADTQDGPPHAFLYRQEKILDLGTLQTRASIANGINSSSAVVGVSFNSLGTQRAFLYRGGEMTDLGGLPGAEFSGARAINDVGNIVGNSHFPDGDYTRAFLLAKGELSELGTLGGSDTEAHTLNTTGDIVGWSRLADGRQRAMVYSDRRMIDLGSLGGASSATGINGVGEIVGQSATLLGLEHALLYRNGILSDLNDLIPQGSSWDLTDAMAINDRGQIVGAGISPSGRIHAYLLTPDEGSGDQRLSPILVQMPVFEPPNHFGIHGNGDSAPPQQGPAHQLQQAAPDRYTTDMVFAESPRTQTLVPAIDTEFEESGDGFLARPPRIGRPSFSPDAVQGLFPT